MKSLISKTKYNLFEKGFGKEIERERLLAES